MPASSQLVSLDHAKDWAKRLHKHGCLPSLAKAQAAVALMLGHADWHGLTQHYQKPPVPVTAEMGERRSMDDSMKALCDEINLLYPKLGATQVIEMAVEMDLLDASPDEVADEVREKENDGYFEHDAIAMTMKAHQCSVKPPPDHILIRVALAKPDQFALVLVTNEVYRRSLSLSW